MKKLHEVYIFSAPHLIDQGGDCLLCVLSCFGLGVCSARTSMAAKRQSSKGPDAPKNEAPKSKQARALDPGQRRLDQANMLTQLKARGADDQLNKAKADTLAVYQALPRFSDEKIKLLELWKKDKSCKWINEYKETHVTEDNVATDIVEGYGTKYDVCKVLNMNYKEDQEIADIILSELPSDDLWDVSKPIEAGYKKAGLKRYKINHAELTRHTHREVKSQTWSATTGKSDKQSLLDSSAASSSSGTVRIKIENPDMNVLSEKIKVLRSGETKIAGAIQEGKKLAATVKVTVHGEATHRHEELLKSIGLLQELQDKTLAFIAMTEAQRGDDGDLIKKLCKEAAALQDEMEHHLDASKLMKKRVRSWLDSV